MSEIAPQLADVVAEKVWKALRPKRMSYLELLHLAAYALDYTGGDVDRAVELLDEIIDPALSYYENKRALEEKIGRKIEPLEEYEKYLAEQKEWVREKAEALSIKNEILEEAKMLEKIKPTEKPRVEIKKLGTPEEEWKKMIERLRKSLGWLNVCGI